MQGLGSFPTLAPATLPCIRKRITEQRSLPKARTSLQYLTALCRMAAADTISSVDFPTTRRAGDPTSSSTFVPSVNPEAGPSEQHHSAVPSSHRNSPSLASSSTQPVLVRAYASESELFQDSSVMLSRRQPAGKRLDLPSIDQFSFDQILNSIEPEIHEAIDAIAEICARSKMSSADSYNAHLPPQGIITASARRIYPALNLRGVGDVPLDAVPEVSSSSERLAGLEGSTLAGSSKSKSPKNADTESDDTELLHEMDGFKGLEIAPYGARSKDGVTTASPPWVMKTRTPTVDLTIVDASPDAFSVSPPAVETTETTDANVETKPPTTSSRTGLAAWIPWPLSASPAKAASRPNAKSALDAINVGN